MDAQVKTQKQKTRDIGIVVDVSASMSNEISSLVDGLNLFIKEQKVHNSECFVSCLKFNSEAAYVFQDQPINCVTLFAKSDFVTNGGTAVRDAIFEMGTYLKINQKHELPPIMIVLTDGNDNCSKTSICELSSILNINKNQGWVYIFLGSNQDVVQNGTCMGFDAENCLAYDFNSECQINAWKATSNACTRLHFEKQVRFTSDEISMVKSKSLLNKNVVPTEKKVTFPMKKKCTIS